ncbi:MAG: hypothetical protein LBJ97_04045 [Mycoplasmataceae bacterium]|jgi:4-hydroxy-3-methylbut-2-enyl diphosphate reductase|nr:hypothetical protein [Mycoplasmataceae bacterium]
MKITILKPYGWCFGVANAIKTIKIIKKKHPNQKIYLIGRLVHNEHLIQQIKSNNIIFLNDDSHSRIDLLKKIKNKQAVIVFSAHGSPINALSYAKTHFNFVYDLTCRYINNNVKLVKKLLSLNYKVIYFGKKHHPETNAILSLNKAIQLAEDKANIVTNNKHKYALVNQSTIPIFDIPLLNDNIKIFNTTCKVVQNRYDNVKKLKNVDLLIIIGDIHSNNSNQLINLAKLKKIPVKLIENEKNIKTTLFDKVNHLAIASGTSVEPTLVTNIIKKIKTTMK